MIRNALCVAFVVLHAKRGVQKFDKPKKAIVQRIMPSLMRSTSVIGLFYQLSDVFGMIVVSVSHHA